ncbi:MAG: hypothetical protein HN576_09210 [Bacteriovoracaceae bacterium]|jgi:hypothetical protein|nr:hypothetical protein [Bacteriovoracaceae bacterium]
MLNLKKILLFVLLILSLGPMSEAFGQDEMDAELLEEMAEQRKDYQVILKNLKAEEFLNNPSIITLMESGDLDFEKIETTITELRKEQSTKVYGQIQPPSAIDLLRGEAHQQVRQLLAPLQNVTEANLKKNLTVKLNEGRVKRFIENSDKFQNFLVKLLKSEKALPHFVLIIDQKNRLYIYLLVNIVLFVFMRLITMISNRNAAKKKFYKKSFFSSFFSWWFKVFAMLGLRIGIFIYFFHKEVEPTWIIFQNTILI